jgi:hypothetical protein
MWFYLDTVDWQKWSCYDSKRRWKGWENTELSLLQDILCLQIALNDVCQSEDSHWHGSRNSVLKHFSFCLSNYLNWCSCHLSWMAELDLLSRPSTYCPSWVYSNVRLILSIPCKISTHPSHCHPNYALFFPKICKIRSHNTWFICYVSSYWGLLSLNVSVMGVQAFIWLVLWGTSKPRNMPGTQ